MVGPESRTPPPTEPERPEIDATLHATGWTTFRCDEAPIPPGGWEDDDDER